MRSKLLTSAELSGLRELNGEVERLELSARNLVLGLEKAFCGVKSDRDIPAMLIKHSDDARVIGSVESKFGKGRFVIAHAIDASAAKSRLIVERAVYDLRDREVWEAVMVIPLPSPEWVIDGQAIRTADERAFVMGASVLYALINGPDA